MRGAQDGKATTRDAWGELGAFAAEGLRAGTLTLRQIAGLTDDELLAVSDVAEELRRSGELAEAAGLYGLLIAYDPLQAAHWRALAGLQQRLGQHALAVACFEVLALLSGRDSAATCSEARSLAQLGQAELGRDLLRLAERCALQQEVVSNPGVNPGAQRSASAQGVGGEHA
ncbi:MAG: hypothetical protein IPL40_09400 [Proteobacteria bacterium]|nr:hypothetical protein [Pseudomonadota bacterium]